MLSDHDTFRVPSSEFRVDSAFGLYIHVPYCLQRCSYCDFFTLTLADQRDQAFASYLRALFAEMESHVEAWQGRPVASIFLGGGTPSLLEPEELAQILEAVRGYWDLQEGAEVTLEVNPETVTLDKLRAFRGIGVNRMSMGVQTLQPEGLALLSRNHSVEGAKRCYDLARRAGFENISCDMIYGWPGQTLAGWQKELETLLAWEPEHLSMYELILEPGTPMTRRINQGELTLPPEQVRLDMYRAARELTAQHDMAWYEISNYARPGYEAQHNLDNWRGSDYLGLGPGAHSFRASPEWGARRANPRNMPMYLENPSAAPWQPRSWTEVCVETLLNGLRLREGWDPTSLLTGYQIDLAALLSKALPPLVEAGYLTLSERWIVSERGAELLDAILVHLQQAIPSQESLVFEQVP